MADPDLEKLERQVEQAKARLQSARARMAEKDRKLDARRKIILGGALIELASRDPRAVRVITTLIESLSRKQDKKAFDGWKPPSPDPNNSADAGPDGLVRREAKLGDGDAGGSESRQDSVVSDTGTTG